MADLHGISHESFDLIVASEVSSREVFERRYRRPTWPAVQSGVTVGIGYDLGQSTKSQVIADWSGRVSDAMLKAMTRACGVTGKPAQALTVQLRDDIDIPWEDALDVFADHDVPRYLDLCTAHCGPDFDDMGPHCRGSILSIVFNRGPSFDASGPRYAEMREIKRCIKSSELAKIPSLIRSMKRLWPDTPGLQSRREREAQLFELGLKEQHGVEPEHHDVPDPDTVAHVQEQLRNLGYFHVGRSDGVKGRSTDAAILAFRHDHDLPLSTDIDDELLSALAKSHGPEISEERANATTHDLREEGSKTISFTDTVKAWAGKLFGGGLSLGGATGVAGFITEKANAISGARDAVNNLGLSPTAWTVIIAAVIGLLMLAGFGLAIWFIADKIEQRRVTDYRMGKHP